MVILWYWLYWGHFQYNLEKPLHTHTYTKDTDKPIAQGNDEQSDDNGQQVSGLQRL